MKTGVCFFVLEREGRYDLIYDAIYLPNCHVYETLLPTRRLTGWVWLVWIVRYHSVFMVCGHLRLDVWSVDTKSGGSILIFGYVLKRTDEMFSY